ncbi:hypothetical protein TW95_gp1318 [Pandoravirus inopinatum]|uniref:Uncharacterized protein n=1 Tax=Pandoravirus inopinatum TaxID=1605721 RepID=A0A0B5JE60_9VIRU|nr:hypothetical protein TW95_gp1318 [Pandoravirus inopinatum]AJF98052.1 hypothetical protein [Pandoravirus inopinatum]
MVKWCLARACCVGTNKARDRRSAQHPARNSRQRSSFISLAWTLAYFAFPVFLFFSLERPPTGPAAPKDQMLCGVDARGRLSSACEREKASTYRGCGEFAHALGRFDARALAASATMPLFFFFHARRSCTPSPLCHLDPDMVL